MSSQNRQKGSVITYSRKKSATTTVKKSPVYGMAGSSHQGSEQEVSRSFWDFSPSSDEDETSKKTLIAAGQQSNGLKRKAVVEKGDEERAGKKITSPNGMSKATVRKVLEAKHVQTTRETKDATHAVTSITPRKSNLKRNPNPTIPAGKQANSRQTLQPPSTPPPANPTAAQSSASPLKSPSPRSSPIPSITPTKRPLTRVPSSPLSTPTSTHKSPSQPNITTPPSRLSHRMGQRSRTFSGFLSPRMTPKQEEIWNSIPIPEAISPSPRRRLVDKLREEASRTPSRPKTPPPKPLLSISQPFQSSIADPYATGIEDEISRVLDYQPPSIIDPPKPKKELSQTESQGTYLSRQRSFLAEPSIQDHLPGLEDLWTTEPDNPPEPMEEDDPGVKSWHELKRGGQDKRLLDEMEDLIEECKPSGRIGLRRSSVLQIVQKLFNDATWRRKFKALGLMSSFIQNVRDAHTDAVLLTTCLLAVDLVPRPVPATTMDTVLEMCLKGLEETRDLVVLASVRSLGVSKILKAEYIDLKVKIGKAKELLEDITAQNLATGILLDLVVQDVRPLCSFLRDYEREQWSALRAVAGSLEKSTQGRLISGLQEEDIVPFTNILLEGITAFETDTTLRKATLSLLRTTINLTNSSTEICNHLNKDLSLPSLLCKTITSNPQLYVDADHHSKSGPAANVKEEQEKGESRFELLVLSLGLMINFVQESQEVKDIVLGTNLANDIKDIFETLISRDEHANHALGYLALLLAHLIIPSKSGKAVVVDGKTRQWVERLLDDFVGIHRVVQSQSQQEVERREVEGMAGEVEKVLVLLRTQV